MEDSNHGDDWPSLCELASKENDPKKLLDLITKINQLLEEVHRNLAPVLSDNARSLVRS
jgi:hypothetical protein